jgi:hypothetical protein
MRHQPKRYTTAHQKIPKGDTMETLFINANKLTRDPSIAPLVGGGFAVGYVDEIHGEGGVEIESFNPTRHEVLQLVKHYAQAILHIKWGWLTMDCVGSSDRRERNFAIARIEQIRTCIGTTLVESVMDEVCSEFGADKDQRTWGIFCRGEAREWAAFADECMAQFDKEWDGKPGDKENDEAAE